MAAERKSMKVAALALLCAACVSEPPAPAPVQAAPDFTFTQVRLDSWRGNKLTVAGNAQQVTYVRRSGDVTARDLSLRGADGEQLHVAMAQGNPTQKVADASGGARLSNAEGFTATGPSFHFHADEQGTRWLTTDAGVEVRAPGMEISAPTLSADLDLQHLMFSSGVSTRLSAAPTP